MSDEKRDKIVNIIENIIILLLAFCIIISVISTKIGISLSIVVMGIIIIYLYTTYYKLLVLYITGNYITKGRILLNTSFYINYRFNKALKQKDYKNILRFKNLISKSWKKTLNMCIFAQQKVIY